MVALCVEAAAILALLLGAGASRAVLTAAALVHACVSAAISVLVRRWLPPSLREPRALVLFSLGSLAFLLPVIGALGVVALAIALAVPRRTPAISPWREVPMPALPFRPLALDGRARSEGYLAAALHRAPNPADRVRAVMALRQLGDRQAAPLLRLALRDAVDDVRLLAYSMLDQQERAAISRIRALELELAAADPNAARLLHARLAESHFEIAWLGLAVGEALRHALARARLHNDAVLAANPDDGGAQLLCGRILLSLGDLVGADAALAQATACGLPIANVAPYRAEVAFRQRRWSDVQRHLQAIPPSSGGLPVLSRLLRYWS